MMTNAPKAADERQATAQERMDAALRARRTRSIAIALALVGLVALFYAATLVRLGAAVMNRPI
jgi:hypothetical protein